MKKLIFCAIVTLLGLTSCQNDDYFQDTGIHDSNYDGTIMKYLKDHSTHFNKLVDIIEYTNQQDLFENAEITFFAPQDVSINKMITSTNRKLFSLGRDTIKNIKDVKADVWKKYLGLYVINNKFELKDIAQVDTITFAFEGQSLVSHNGRVMNAGVMYHNANGVQYAGYRMILYAYIQDFSETKTSRMNVPVSSSNIKPTNGVVHVLRAKDHYFGFQPDNFIEDILNGGLTEED